MKQKRNSTTKLRILCAIVFMVFAYLYLSCYQAELLAVAQHIFSDGVTTYSYVLSPWLITLSLFLLQLGMYGLVRVKKTFHALTYFPSLLVLAMITSVPSNISKGQPFGAWLWVFPLLLALFGFSVWVIRQLEPYEAETGMRQWMTKRTWMNLLQLIVMMLFVVLVSNGDQVFHSRLKMERLMLEGRYADALKVGNEIEKTDSSLTMLRVACLYKTHQMGELLFTYPLMGGSKAMIPDSVTTKALMWKAPKWMTRLENGKLKYLRPLDYQLCGYLMDKNLDKFVEELKKHCDVDSASLPRHYKEALVLYTHRRMKPLVAFHNTVMETDFQDFQSMERKYTNEKERNTSLRDSYGATYWYYYRYGKN